jgi:hypothetical protein
MKLNFRMYDEDGFVRRISNNEFKNIIEDLQHSEEEIQIIKLALNDITEFEIHKSFFEDLFVGYMDGECKINKNFQIVIYNGHKKYGELYHD